MFYTLQITRYNYNTSPDFERRHPTLKKTQHKNKIKITTKWRCKQYLSKGHNCYSAKNKPAWHRSAHRLALSTTDGDQVFTFFRNCVRYILFNSPPSYLSCKTTSGTSCRLTLSPTAVIGSLSGVASPDWSPKTAPMNSTPRVRVNNLKLAI